MKILQEIKKYFTFHKDALSLEEDQLFTARLYAFLGVIFTPLNLIATLEFQNEYNILANFVIILLFVIVLIGSYKSKYLEEKIHNGLFILFTLISLYTIVNAYLKGMPYNEVFAILILLFVFSIVIEDIKKLLIYFLINSVGLVLAILLSEESTIDKSYLFSFLTIFLIINFVVNRGKSKNKNKLINREKFLKTLFNETADGFMLVNVHTKDVIDCNKQLLLLLDLEDKSKIVGFKKDIFKKFKDTVEEYKKVHDQVKKNKVYHKNSIFITSKGKEFIADTVYSMVNIERNDFYFIRITDISERLENEKRVLLSEKKYKSLFEKNVAGVFRTSLTGNFISINTAFAKTFGYTKSELYKESTSCLYFSEEDRNIYMDNVLENKKLHNHELHLKKKNGEEVWVLINIAVRTEDNVQYIEGTLIDITNIIKAKKQLLESEERFKILSNVAIEGVVLSKNEIIIDANDQFISIHGYNSVDEIIGKSFADFVIPKDYQLVKDHLKTIKSDAYIVSSRKKDGSEIVVETRGMDIPFGNDIIRASVVLDVTERIQKEQQVLESEERFKRLSEVTKEGVSIISEPGIILDVNKSFCDIFGYSANELLGKNILELSKQEFIKENERRLEEKDESYYDGIGIKKDKSEIFIRISGRAIPYKEGKAIVVMINDIGEEKKLQEEQIRAELAENANKLLNIEITERENIQQELGKTQKFLGNIINSSLDIIISTDTDGFITNFNKAAEKTFGYKLSEVIGKTSSILYSNNLEENQIKLALNSKKGKFFGEIINKTKKGKTFISYISASTLKDEKGNSIGSMGVSRDITNIKAAEEKLKLSEERYRDLFENATDLIQSIDNKGNIMFVNKAWKDTLGYKEKEIIGESIFKFIHPDCKEHCTTLFDKILGGETVNQIEIEFITKKGNKVIVEGNISSKIEEGKAVATRGIFRDVTLNKEIQQILINKKSQLSGIINTTNDIILSVNKDLIIIESNKFFNNLVKQIYNIDIDSNTSVLDVTPEPIKERVTAILVKVFEGHFHEEIFEFEDIENAKVVSDVSYNPIFSEEKEVIAVAIFSRNITEKNAIDEEIKKGLKEKEILLAEIHHRVKNNLQVISSILNLQSSYVTDEGTLNVLKESQNRVKSMSFIHESLYQTKDFSSIKFSEYIKTLSSNLMYSYQVYDDLVGLKTECDDIQIHLDQSIPAGLIINELITNALKYGFPNEKEGEILIKLTEKDNFVTIIVADNGVGMTKDINFENTDSLGLQLVHTLSEQLDATLNYETGENKGVRFEIKFKKI